MKNLLIIAFIGSIIVSTNIEAQVKPLLAKSKTIKTDVNNCTICTEALKQGTYDEFKHETNHTLDESVNTLFSNDYEFWSSYSGSSSHNESLDAAYKVFSFSFAGSGSDTQKKEEFNKQKSTYIYSRSLSQNDVENISQRLINKVPYETFLRCVQSTCGTGLFFDQQVAGDDIIITARWVINGGDPNQTSKLNLMSIVNATNVDFNFKIGATIKPLNSISGVFKRVDPTKDVIISFDFENFPAQQITIKRSRNQNFNTPVGTIVISELDLPTFCSLNDIPSRGSNTELIWVPADGRNVGGSIYGGKQLNVPDLRGVFLRGLNIFDPVTNPTIKHPEQLDLHNRSVNDLQIQDIKAHSHPIKDPGHSHVIGLHPNGGSGGFGASGSDGDPVKKDHGTDSQITGIIKTQDNVGEETRPTNIAVYYYIKIN